MENTLTPSSQVLDMCLQHFAQHSLDNYERAPFFVKESLMPGR